jgi:hypothetical protein
VEIEDVRRLVDRAFEIEDPTELETLAKERPSALVPFHLRLADSEFRWVADLYREMTEETATELVRRLDADDDPDGLLHMLAAGGTSTAVEAFRGLGEPATRLSHAGGWELTPSGEVRSLTSWVAITLASSPAPVSGGRLGECGWCGFPMWRLLDVDRAVLPDLFGTGPGRMVISTCTLCGSYATIFTATEDGRFAAVSERPEAILGKWQPYELDGLPDAPPLGLGAARPSPFAGDAWETGGSTLGGSPQWIQNPEYPSCPRCSRTMPFVGMITGGDLWTDLGEGCFYLFHDPDCGLSAVVYQQS